MPAPDSDPDASLDSLVFRYLEASDRSSAEARRFLEDHRRTSPDQGSALDSAIRQLDVVGLLGETDELHGWIVGDYSIVRRLGRGGMGDVFLARPVDGGALVALKLLRRELSDDDDSRRRMLREAAALQHLDHPTIARFLAAGESDGLPYLVSEYIEGMSLAAAIRAIEGVPPAELVGAHLGRSLELGETVPPIFEGRFEEAAARIAREVARALAHAHARGVVHRDVKPSNIMLLHDGRVVLVDFGLASLADSDALTASGHRVGSLPYMAPEDLRGAGAPGPATDIYALGVTLFETCARRLPFQQRHPDRLAIEVIHGRRRSLRESLPQVRAELETVVDCAMALTPERRYPSAEAFAADLTEFLAGRPVRARAPGAVEQLQRWCHRHPARATAAALLGAGLLVVPAAYGALQRAHATETRRLNVELSSSLAAAAAAEEEALAAAQKALEAIESQLRRVASIGLEDTPRGAGIRRQLVEDAFMLIDEIPDLPRLEQARSVVECALTRTRADLLCLAGDERGALDLYLGLAARLRASLASRPEDVRLRAELGTLLGQVAATLSDLGRADEASSFYAEGLPLIARALSEGWRPGTGDATYATARAHQALDLFKLGQVEEAQARGTALIAELEAWPDDMRSLPSARLALAASHRLIAQVAASRRAFGQAIGAEERCAECLEAILAEQPQHRRALHGLASTWKRQALAWLQLGDSARAGDLLERSGALSRDLRKRYPEWLVAVAAEREILALRAQQAAAVGDGREALALTVEVVESWRAQPESDPLRVSGLAAALGNAANQVTLFAPEDQERLRTAEAMATEAMELLEHGRSIEAAKLTYWMLPYNRSVLRSKLGDTEGARADLDELTRLTERAQAGQPMVQRYLADAWCELLGAYRANGVGVADAAAFAKEQVYLYLEGAVASGYADRDDLMTHAGLAALRHEPRFEALLSGIE
ncbi:MAG: serine/threonine-protein kinase [Planctomycetota bacterium]